MTICYLNRKPYRDRDGLLRERKQSQCCRNRDRGCTLTKQPEGVVISARHAKALSKVSGIAKRSE
jgi:hypothetical protein